MCRTATEPGHAGEQHADDKHRKLQNIAGEGAGYQLMPLAMASCAQKRKRRVFLTSWGMLLRRMGTSARRLCARVTPARLLVVSQEEAEAGSVLRLRCKQDP